MHGVDFFRFELDRMPVWLISIMSLFMPVCFPSHPHNLDDLNRRAGVVALQEETFFYMGLIGCLVYIPSLAAVGYLVNYDIGWNYDENVIFQNAEFNAILVFLGVNGFLAFLLSTNSKWHRAIFGCLVKKDTRSERNIVKIEKSKFYRQESVRHRC